VQEGDAEDDAATWRQRVIRIASVHDVDVEEAEARGRNRPVGWRQLESTLTGAGQRSGRREAGSAIADDEIERELSPEDRSQLHQRRPGREADAVIGSNSGIVLTSTPTGYARLRR
jgi:hypothetical protein